MALILRADVDKPYGRSSLFQKVTSKLREDYWFPAINSLGYLGAVAEFLKFLNSNEVPGIFYFRVCTAPNKKVLQLLEKGNHVIGLHAENTRSFSTFNSELDKLKASLDGKEVSTFSKHGSGVAKLGKNHYPPYEPDKYLEWGKQLNIQFPFGNGICNSKNDFINQQHFYPNVFWIENECRHPNMNSLEEIIAIAKNNTVPVLIHPENFFVKKAAHEDLITLIKLSKEAGVAWETAHL